ncbi:sigma-70 family RNA polymerase sigma factor [Alteromonas sp. 1_MG-2023]|uniref:sigma-70 family RNA polymerase sigma factor n=1 Tax=Alteromonas sp. 1_MG-2023 TaxID=3062669 RepID=UPI0026E3EAF5|nr:sigma-70 family RNA polymerase sigma factor [Alteromonas sp. 1_MG-2023]MDO6566069.1 sigma-70 family RNA polymerase sigma factor [Alteromonas sp. 1_MG-2023]
MSYAGAGLLISVKDWFSSPSSAESLMDRYVRTGEQKALSALYDQHSNALYYYLLVMSNADMAADITQKTWVKVIEKKHLYRHEGKFLGWLFTLGRNTLLDEFRKQYRQDSHSNQIDSLVADESALDGTPDFHQLLRQLPFEQKEAFSLQQEGFSIHEIGTICDVPHETVKTRLRYAREKLKKALETQS